MKFQVLNRLGQLQVFTQHDDKGDANTLRLYSDKPLIIEVDSKDKLPKEILKAEKLKFVLIRELKEDGTVKGYFSNNVNGGGE